MTRRSPARFYDPTGARFGLPTYPWGMAPGHLMTLRQLAACGKRPGGQQVVAQVLWHSTRHTGSAGRVRVRAAYLYDVRLALPKRVPTAAQRAALGKALRARRICPDCGRDAGYVLRRRWGVCNDCADRQEIAA
ncbi:RRQRL motif-containing zinc-binding protein [Actinomadura hibisca]|uniref:RRQRL motif-containing zinc-binding protein n=1 Tax=Actinomadura hibisca TaxID=68565 RepID=UPI000832F79D|nr:RRQRL motif-containing zinc-binding protein [Actinomadura hibisca]